MSHPIYPGRRDPEQEAYDKHLKLTSEREALDKAAMLTRADLLKHMGKIRPGQIEPPKWDTYKNRPEMSGNSAMTDYILRYNAENPQRPFQPERYTPPARRAAPAVAPAAAPSRVMANAPAVGVQASASNPQVRTGAPVDFPQQIKDPRTGMLGQTTNTIRNSVLNAPKAGASPLDAIPVPGASAVQQSASGAQQPGPLDTLRSAAPRPPGIRDDGEAAIQKFLRNEIANMNPDNRPGAKVGWMDDGRGGRLLVSVPDGERSGMAHSDARREFYRKHYQDRADAYAGTMQRGQKPSAEGSRAWNKANPFNSDMYERDAQAYADAAVAPRPVTSRAPVDYTGGAPARVRFDNGPGTALPSASATFPNGKVERKVFTRPSATPTTDAVTNAGLGLDSLGFGGAPKLAMTAGAMGAGAANLAKQNPSMLAGANTGDQNSTASQAIDAVSAVKKKPMAPTSAVKAAGTGLAAGVGMSAKAEPATIAGKAGNTVRNAAFGAANMASKVPGAIESGISAINDAKNNFWNGMTGSDGTEGRVTSTETRQPGPLWNPPPDTAPPAVKTEGAGAADGGQPGIGSRIVFPALKASSDAFTGLALGAGAVKAAGTGNAGAMTAGATNLAKQNASRNTAGSRLYNRTEVSPMDALISPKVGYGGNAPSAIASAQSYQAANPGIKFTNKVDDETLSANYPIVNSNKEDTGSYADFDAYRKLITTYPEGRSNSAGKQDATIAHELLHGTQPRPMDTPSVIARAKEAIRTRNDTLADSSTDAEAGARLPRLNRAWVNAGNSFPQNTDDAAKIYSAFGIHPPGKPSTASPPQGWDQDPANSDIKNMIKSYRLMPKRKQQEFYDKWLPQQPGLASRDSGNGFESAA